MFVALSLSVVLGLLWNSLAVHLLGGRLVDAFSTAFAPAGAIAGLVAGMFTIWSRRKMDGGENVFYGVATYYVGIVVYWLSFVVIERAAMCLRHGGWTDFDLQDHLVLIWTLLMYGTLGAGVVLIPLTFLSRHLVWRVYQRAT
jgi:hypothetical protein